MVDLNSANRGYIEGLYVQYCQDPGSLDPEWVAFFKGFTFGLLKSNEEGEEGGACAWGWCWGARRAFANDMPRTSGRGEEPGVNPAGYPGVNPAGYPGGHPGGYPGGQPGG